MCLVTLDGAWDTPSVRNLEEYTMTTPSQPRPPEQLADCIPSPDLIRARLDRATTEADLLRKQLRLALRRQQEAQRLMKEEVDGVA
jgi:hypothetical protein